MDEIQVFRESQPGRDALTNRHISIVLETELTPELVAEGWAREAVNRIQRSRKELSLHVSDRINVVFAGDADLVAALTTHHSYVAGETLAVQLEAGEPARPVFEAEIDERALVYSIEVAEGG
jgi:isoleucyl-tRNA synthetase